MRNLMRYNLWRIRHPATGDAGDAYHGAFRMRVGNGNRIFLIIASASLQWDHVSVSLPDRCPTWEEMKAAKQMFFEDDEWAIEYHPPVALNVSVHPYCLHLWRPQTGLLPVPQLIMV